MIDYFEVKIYTSGHMQHPCLIKWCIPECSKRNTSRWQVRCIANSDTKANLASKASGGMALIAVTVQTWSILRRLVPLTVAQMLVECLIALLPSALLYDRPVLIYPASKRDCNLPYHTVPKKFFSVCLLTSLQRQ